MGDMIPKRPVKEYARENGRGRIGDEAAERIIQHAEQYMHFLISTGSDYADSADRVTLLEEDVEKAEQQHQNMK